MGRADAAAGQARLILRLEIVHEQARPHVVGGVVGDASRKGSIQRHVCLVGGDDARQRRAQRLLPVVNVGVDSDGTPRASGST